MTDDDKIDTLAQYMDLDLVLEAQGVDTETVLRLLFQEGLIDLDVYFPV